MVIETSRARGVHHLQPAKPAMTEWHRFGLEEPDIQLVQKYAAELNDSIALFHRRYDPWVQKIGGKSYSEITAISQHMLLKLLGISSFGDLDKFASTPFPKIAHLTWRIISAIDDYGDSTTREADVRNLTDSEGTPVAKMIQELIRIPGSDKLSRWFIKAAHKHIKKHEYPDLSFTDAVKAKEKTTGLFTLAATLGVWPFLLATFPKNTAGFPPKEFVQHSISCSLIAQCMDDIADFKNDLGNPSASSLIIAAARDANELEILKRLSLVEKPLTVSELLKQNLKTPIIFLEYFQSLINKLPLAPTEMKAYFQHQFFNLESD